MRNLIANRNVIAVFEELLMPTSTVTTFVSISVVCFQYQ